MISLIGFFSVLVLCVSLQTLAYSVRGVLKFIFFSESCNQYIVLHWWDVKIKCMLPSNP